MTESIQKRLLRVRPPRVKITYDVETGGAIEKRELPFIVGILADLSGDRDPNQVPTPLKERKMVDIDRDNFNDVMKTIGPRVDLVKIPKTSPSIAALLSTPEDKQIVFENMADFEPMQVIQKLPGLRALYESRGLIRSLQASYESDDDIAHHVDALMQNNDPAKQADNFRMLANFPVAEDPEKTALRKALLALLDGNTAAAEVPGTDAAANDAAAKAKATLLLSWSLISADDVANPKMMDRAAQNAAALARALSAPDNLENRHKARLVIEQLQLAGAAPENANDEVKASFTKRSDLLSHLGFDAKAAEAATDPTFAGIKLEDLNGALYAPTNDPVWAKPLLILGMTGPDDAAQLAFLNFAKFIHGTTPSPVQLGIMDALTPLLQVDAAKTVLRLYHFSLQVRSYFGNNDDMSRMLSAQKRGAAAVIDELVAHCDQQLSTALSAILHCPGFKQMEATWRGLGHLVFNTETSTMLKLRVFNAQQAELTKDMDKAVEFDQSVLFKLVYEAEYGTYGGFPYSLLIGGYEIGAGAADIDFLKKMSEIAAAAHAPFIAAASTSMFGLSGFDKLDKPRDLAKIFENAELTAWREFRETEDARYVSLVMPRVMLRLPYGRPEKRNTTPCEGINFEENVSGEDLTPYFSPKGDLLGYPKPDNQNFLWGNAAYVLAERITNAFSLYNWTAAIRGVEGGGLVEGLPLYSYTNNAGSSELFCPIEVSITDRREKELNDLGFISLCHCKGTGRAAFFGGQTTNLPKKYFSDDANANAKISAMLPYILAASRFAHYIKVIMRDKIGSFMTRGNVESFLNGWIANYVLLDDNASQEVKSAYPLREASVVVTDVPGEPGVYRATVFLKPHFQLEELTTSIRLVAKLPG